MGVVLYVFDLFFTLFNHEFYLEKLSRYVRSFSQIIAETGVCSLNTILRQIITLLRLPGLAGYSEHCAGQIGYENLQKPHIREALEARKAELVREIRIDQLRTLREIQAMRLREC